MTTMRKRATAVLGLLSLLCIGPAALGAPTAAPPARPEAAMAAAPASRPTPPTAQPAEGAGEPDEPPPDAVPAPPEEPAYRPIELEVHGLVWLEPGQRGLLEAHPLVMGLAAMALATVTLLFFFLRGVKRPRDEELDGAAGKTEREER